jgi:hypothetical protein
MVFILWESTGIPITPMEYFVSLFLDISRKCKKILTQMGILPAGNSYIQIKRDAQFNT